MLPTPSKCNYVGLSQMVAGKFKINGATLGSSIALVMLINAFCNLITIAVETKKKFIKISHEITGWKYKVEV